MIYSIEPRIYVKGYECSSFEKKIFGKNVTKVGKSMRNKYVKNFLTVLKNLQQAQQKLLQKEKFKKLQKQLVI